MYLQNSLLIELLFRSLFSFDSWSDDGWLDCRSVVSCYLSEKWFTTYLLTYKALSKLANLTNGRTDGQSNLKIDHFVPEQAGKIMYPVYFASE